MKKLLFTLSILFLGINAQAQRYDIITQDICWNTGSVDSSLTRYFLVSPLASTVKVLAHLNSAGQKVTPSGGTFSAGHCGCCGGTTGSTGGGAGTLINANNGVSLDGDTVILGGTIKMNTVINGMGIYGLDLTNLKYLTLSAQDSINFITPDLIAAAAKVGGVLRLNSATGRVDFTRYKFPIEVGVDNQYLAYDSVGDSLRWVSPYITAEETDSTYRFSVNGSSISEVEFPGKFATHSDVSDSLRKAVRHHYDLTTLIDQVDTSRLHDGAQMVQLGNYIYELGGWRGSLFTPETRNTVYIAHVDSTEDMGWRQLVNAPWEERHTFGAGVIGDTIYVWGSDNQADTSAHDSWKAWVSGPNGELSWAQKADTLPYPYRILAGYTVHNDYLYTVGGQVGLSGNEHRTDVWRSTDALNWTQMTNTAIFDTVANYDGALVSWRGCLWLTSGGRYSPRTYNREVFRSCDNGVNWEEVVEASIPNEYEPVQYTKSIVFENRLWMTMGGAPSNNNGINQVIVLDSLDDGWQWTSVWNDDTNGRHAHGGISTQTTSGEKYLLISTGTDGTSGRKGSLIKFTNYGQAYYSEKKIVGDKQPKNESQEQPLVLWNEGYLVDSELREDSLKVTIDDGDLGKYMFIQLDAVNGEFLPSATFMEDNNLDGTLIYLEDSNSVVVYGSTLYTGLLKTERLNGLGIPQYAAFAGANLGLYTNPTDNGIFRNGGSSLGFFSATNDRQGGRSHLQIGPSTGNATRNIGFESNGSIGYLGGFFGTFMATSSNGNSSNLTSIRNTGGDVSGGLIVDYTGLNYYAKTNAVENEAIRNGSSKTNLHFRVDQQGGVWMSRSDPQVPINGNFQVGVGLYVEDNVKVEDMTATPTFLVGRNDAKILGDITLGSGLNLMSGTLSASASAPTAQQVSIADLDNHFDSTNVEGALQTLADYDTVIYVNNNDILAWGTILDRHKNIYVVSQMNSSSTSDNDLVFPTPTTATLGHVITIFSRDLDNGFDDNSDTAISSSGTIRKGNTPLSGYICAGGEVVELQAIDIDGAGTIEWQLSPKWDGWTSTSVIGTASPTVHLERKNKYVFDAATQGLTTNTLEVSDLEPGDEILILILGADGGNDCTIDLSSGDIIYDNLSGDATEVFTNSRLSLRGIWTGTDLQLW